MADARVVVATLPAGFAAALESMRAIVAGLTGEVRVLVVRGAGADFFGVDLPGDRSSTAAPQWARDAENEILSSLRSNDLISVAVLHGRATDVGLALALACDQRIATDDAQLAVVADTGHRRLDVAAIASLGDLAGRAAALDLAATGRTFNGGEALQLGVVNRCVPAGELDEAVDACIARLLAQPRAVVAEVKAVLSASATGRFTDDLASGLELAAMQG